MVDGKKCWIVSGYIVRDKMNRAKQVGVPTTADYTNEGVINNKDESLKYSTVYEYDDFGRFYRATMPNTYSVTKEYDINKGTDGIEIVDIIKDSENRLNTEYKDMLGNVIRSVTKAEKGKEITTSFKYDLHSTIYYEFGLLVQICEP